ncbi:SIS domain-containing protein [[Clostridium] hylemonae]|uniref:Glutamine--fructose-6-phosphate aminotransferase [isomerizing] n=1 Tax=[Clostridium] hylemonae DSM 15053 TaxID=553973 RepID=C0C183_9FIRM|nr:SIS domain-containing protein [[Clostridium] hylemonae]EEG73897.1 SIS domain protein [[Clostridium] hylemonae DSM 15053]QEK19289.1 Isomerizing glutamine--fructose-6-phosphate aminotransferase [[Clostridium] hylemonae DSM 15053]
MNDKILPPLLKEDSILNAEDRALLMNLYEEEGDNTWKVVAGDDPLDERRLARNSYTYEELVGQPDKIRETLSREKEAVKKAAGLLGQREIRQIYMVGCGDSVAALRGVRFFLESLLGIPCKEEDALDFAYYNSSAVDEKTLVITLSSSGRTVRVVEALLAARARGAQTLALSNTPDSPLMKAASAGILIHASRKGWPTQSSTAAMAVTVRLGLELGRVMGVSEAALGYYEEQFDKVPGLMEQAIEMTEKKIRKMAEELYSRKMFFFCGGGPFFTCAEYGAAKVKEATPVYAVPVLLEEFHHYNTLKKGDPLFLIAPPGYSVMRAIETIWAGKELGGSVIVLTSKNEAALVKEADEAVILPEAEECFANFVYAVPLQLFGYYLSVEQEKKAREKLGE